MKLSLFSKIFLSLPLLAILIIVFINYLPLHSDSSEATGTPCLFETVTRAKCTGETGDLNLVGYHSDTLSNTFTAIPGTADFILSLAVLTVGLGVLVHLTANRYELYAQILIKQKWREGQSLDKLFDPLKTALRSGILERKEPSLVIA